MSSYADLAPHFDAIFSLSDAEKRFYDGLAIGERDTVIEIGCGTGELVRLLARYSAQVTGMDLDADMITVARKKAMPAERVRFIVGGMADIGRFFAPASCAHILCVGNTLVHLNSLDAITRFFEDAAALLMPRGGLVVQVLNYDKILQRTIERLPVIENDQVRFERRYAPVPGTRLLHFERTLTVKASGERYESAVDLYPLTIDELRVVSGRLFTESHFLGSFRGDDWSPDSDLLVARFRRPRHGE